jgi:hypothetical protein
MVLAGEHLITSLQFRKWCKLEQFLGDYDCNVVGSDEWVGVGVVFVYYVRCAAYAVAICVCSLVANPVDWVALAILFFFGGL